MIGAESSMGGSEMGDQDTETPVNQNKSGQRISQRVKQPVNYNSMAQGTSEISANMDYQEVSGLNSRALQKKNSTTQASTNNTNDIK